MPKGSLSHTILQHPSSQLRRLVLFVRRRFVAKFTLPQILKRQFCDRIILFYHKKRAREATHQRTSHQPITLATHVKYSVVGQTQALPTAENVASHLLTVCSSKRKNQLQKNVMIQEQGYWKTLENGRLRRIF